MTLEATPRTLYREFILPLFLTDLYRVKNDVAMLLTNAKKLLFLEESALLLVSKHYTGPPEEGI